MKAITIQQPYAALIAEGIKEYEFRTWKTAYRGPLLIHAGKGMDKKACSRFALYNLDYLAGAVIAKAELTDCIAVDDAFRRHLQEKNPEVYAGIIEDTTWKGYAFKLERVEKLAPVLMNGKLSLWECDIE